MKRDAEVRSGMLAALIFASCCSCGNATRAKATDAAPDGCVTAYRDQDGDGYAVLEDKISVCGGTPPSGYIINPLNVYVSDCNDQNSDFYPSASAAEIVGDREDSNCDGLDYYAWCPGVCTFEPQNLGSAPVCEGADPFIAMIDQCRVCGAPLCLLLGNQGGTETSGVLELRWTSGSSSIPDSMAITRTNLVIPPGQMLGVQIFPDLSWSGSWNVELVAAADCDPTNNTRSLPFGPALIECL